MEKQQTAQAQVPQQATPAQPARQITPLARFNSYIISSSTQNYLAKVLGAEKNSFVNNIIGVVSNSPMLQKCEPSTVMFAAIKATALKLPLDQNLGFAYVIPYGTQAQFQIGWKGFVQLALRTNLYKTINVRDVRLGEIDDEDFVSGEMRFHSLPAQERQQAPVVGYLAFFELTNGFRKMSYWTVEEVQAHGMRFSKTYSANGGVWQTNFDVMARKTVLKQLIGKYGPMSIDMQAALTADQAVLSDGKRTYVDNGDESFVEPVEMTAEPDAEPQGDAEKVMAAARAAETRQAQ